MSCFKFQYLFALFALLPFALTQTVPSYSANPISQIYYFKSLLVGEPTGNTRVYTAEIELAVGWPFELISGDSTTPFAINTGTHVGNSYTVQVQAGCQQTAGSYAAPGDTCMQRAILIYTITTCPLSSFVMRLQANKLKYRCAQGVASTDCNIGSNGLALPNGDINLTIRNPNTCVYGGPLISNGVTSSLTSVVGLADGATDWTTTARTTWQNRKIYFEISVSNTIAAEVTNIASVSLQNGELLSSSGTTSITFTQETGTGCSSATTSISADTWKGCYSVQLSGEIPSGSLTFSVDLATTLEDDASHGSSVSKKRHVESIKTYSVSASVVLQ